MKDINKSLKEIQEKNDQKLEALTRETQKSLKEIQENMGQKIVANKKKMQKSLKQRRTRWLKASVGTLLTETKALWQHLNPTL